jgi:hypothetical protein
MIARTRPRRGWRSVARCGGETRVAVGGTEILQMG